MLASKSWAGVFVRLFVYILCQGRKHLREKKQRKSISAFHLKIMGRSEINLCIFKARRRARAADLSPAAVPADHVRVGHGGEERVRLQVLRQAR